MEVATEVFPSAGENAGMILVSCRSWKCVPTAVSGSVDISEITECHLL